jgi:hypothetical protein
MKVRITFMEEALGLTSANPELFEEFQASRSADAEKMEEELKAQSASERIDKAMTIFPKLEDGTPFFWDYQIKGAFKDFCKACAKVPKSKSSGLKAYKSAIDNLIFPEPRKIPMALPAGSKMGTCTRPLRGGFPERVALACSETVPAGTTLEVTVTCLDPSLEKLVEEWLNYGKYKGLSQWRNSGKGRFTWERI